MASRRACRKLLRKVASMSWACTLNAPQSYCMAWPLSKQDDFVNQVSMLETLIKEASHECIFLPKSHCELNSIEMVSLIITSIYFTLKFTSSVLGMGQVPILSSSKEDIQRCKECGVGCTQLMPH